MLIGKRVKVKYPSGNNKMKEMVGVVLDKFQNSFVDPREVGKGDYKQVVPLVVTYDNYLIESDNGEVTSVHPTLITEVIEDKEVLKISKED